MKQRTARVLARHFAHELAQYNAFVNQELPSKIALGVFEVEAPSFTLESRQLTDQILLEILAEDSFSVINQDSEPGQDGKLRLQRYEDPKSLQFRGALLGADYYVWGVLREHDVLTKRGKSRKNYTIDVTVLAREPKAEPKTWTMTFSEAGKFLRP